MQIIDAHCHFWRLARGDYGWLAGEGGPLAPIRRDFLPRDYPAEAPRLIAVQAAPTVAETEFLLALAAEEPRIAGVVGWVDMTDPGAVETLQRLAADQKFKGIRPMLQDIADTDWLLTAPLAAVLAAITSLGLRFDALVTQRHLPNLLRFVERHPDLPVVIDHAAKPQPEGRAGWEAGLRRLGENTNAFCKLSGLLTEFSLKMLARPADELRAILSRLLDWFGPQRLIWGSDWPVLTLAADYDRWRDLTAEALRELSPAEQAAIMGGNAARFYGVTP